MKADFRSQMRLTAFALVAFLGTGFHASAEDQPSVGVALPSMVRGARTAMRGLSPEMYAKLPKKYRQQMEQNMQAAITNANQMRDTMVQQLAPAVQRTWIDMLRAKGIAAVEVASPPAGVSSSLVLRSEVEATAVAASSQRTPRLDSGPESPSIRRSLTVHYSLTDSAGHAVLPTRDCSGEDVSAENESNTFGGGKDLWTQCGNEIVATVSSVLPVGSVKYVDPKSSLPKPPSMTDSLRLDISTTTGTFFKGKPFGPSEEGGSYILELAGGAISTQDRKIKTGTLVLPDDPRVFVINDADRTYYALTPKDLQGVNAVEQSFQHETPATPRLVRVGTDGRTVRYTAGGGETVLIDYSESNPGWKKGVQQLQLHGDLGTGWIKLTDDTELTAAIWNELAESEGPPRLIKVQKGESAGRGRRAASIVSETVIKFKTTESPKSVDFTVPPSYKLHSSPYLQMAFMP